MKPGVSVLIVGLWVIAIALSGCEKAAQNMYNQPKFKPLAASTLWPDGQSARPDETGTVAQSGGALAGTSSGRLGALSLPENPAVDTLPTTIDTTPMTIDIMRRGQERFNIYCSPCHSEAGDGDGMVVRRGFPRPPSFHIDRLRNAPDAHFLSVITRGYGAMYSYADRVESQDRRAIVAYIRALQLSQNASVADVPQDRRDTLVKAGK